MRLVAVHGVRQDLVGGMLGWSQSKVSRAISNVMETIKDPIGQVGHIQDQIKEQIKDVSGDISQKIDVDSLRSASKSDYKDMMELMKSMSKQIQSLTKKVDQLEKPKK